MVEAVRTHMTRSRLAWVLSLGLLAAGWAMAHGVAYRIVVPDGLERRQLLEATGHSYLDPAPVFSLCLTLVALGLVACLLSRDAKGPVRNPSPWLVASLPLLGFAVQEHLERFIHDGQVPFTAALEPTFVIGLLLQLPFALAALLFARALLTFAATFVRALRARPAALVRAPAFFLEPVVATWPQPRAFVLGHGQRAPPLRA